MMSPHSAIPCSESLVGDGRFGHVFAVEEDKNGINPAALFNFDKSSLDCNDLESSEVVSSMPIEDSNLGSMGGDVVEAVHSSNMSKFLLL